MPRKCVKVEYVGIAEELKGFIQSYIDSVEQLEVLLLLMAQRRDWSAPEVSRTLAIQPESAAVRLVGLYRNGLLDARDDGRGRSAFRYSPNSANLARLADDLVRTYRERKHSVITLIATRPSELVQVFRGDETGGDGD